MTSQATGDGPIPHGDGSIGPNAEATEDETEDPESAESDEAKHPRQFEDPISAEQVEVKMPRQIAEHESTEPAEVINPRHLKYKQSGSLARVTRKRNEITNLMVDEENLHVVKSELTVFNEHCVSYQSANTDLCDVLHSENDIDIETRRYEDRQMSIIGFRGQVTDWIRKAERHLTDDCESASQSSKHSRKSRSSRSSKSSRSNVSAAAREKARIAELLIEKGMLRRQQNLKIQTDELKLELEIAKAQARERIYLADENQAVIEDKRVTYPLEPNIEVWADCEVPDTVTSTKVSINSDTQQLPTATLGQCTSTSVMLNADAPSFIPSSDVSIDKSQGGHLITTSALLAALSLPQPEVAKFSGDLMLYKTFMNAFDTRVASRTSSSADKLYYLEQHLVGEPKELISGCLHMDPGLGYIESRTLLDKEYGDPYKLSLTLLKEINGWSVLKQDDNVGIKHFSLFLIKCNNAMQSLSYLHVLNNPSNMLCIVHKLPFYLQNKWRERASKARRREQKVLTYPDLVDFVRDAADTANDPVYGKTTLIRHDTSYHHQDAPIKYHKEQASRITQKTTSFATNVSADCNRLDQSLCLFCQQPHDLDNCKFFAKKSIHDRRDFIKDKRLCFACYGNDHFSKGCTHKRKCTICGKPHPTALHVDGFTIVRSTQYTGQQNYHKLPDQDAPNQHSTLTNSSNIDAIASSVSMATDVNDSVVMLAILPVCIYQKGSDTCITTYCFYDNGSSGCFITNDLFEHLEASGVPTRLDLKTMHGHSCISSTVVRDLVITDINGHNPIELPRTYTRDEIPVNAQHIPKPEMIHRWHHLKCLSQDIPAFISNMDVGILVGNNCPLALEPQEVIPMVGHGPFATRLRHGWTVYGPQQSSQPGLDNVSCNPINIQETSHVKELMTTDSILRVLEMDFNDYNVPSVPGECGMSQEDRKFIDFMDTHTVFHDGQYTVPLPFRDENISMPNNKSQALKRGFLQQKKMTKNGQYHDDYKSFMQKLLDNNYAELVSNEQLATLPGKVWYLPHHGVYNPNKPNKIRVVFDCSAKFAGTSLNDRLLQGPDLANNLVGVLIRFRVDQIAFCGDVESMFYRVKVPEEQRRFLRFMWWPNGDIQKDMKEYQMNVHIFGAISSPSVANYILKKLGTQSLNPLVTHTINRNFYVDDCLKSVKTSDIATHLIEDLCRTCMEGGLRLTKFISNNNDVISSIPMDEQAKEMLSMDIYHDPLPVIRALGVQWCIKNDDFGFSIVVKDKPLTRRGILAVVSSLYDPLGFVAPVILPAKRILQDLCKEKKLGWDDMIPDQHITRWHKWLSTLPQLGQLSISRCFKPDTSFQVPITMQLHVFADASSTGYGTVAYLRLSNGNGAHHVSFVAGKARLTPLKYVTIPRLELTAAVTAVRLGCMIQREMDESLDVRYYTDSSTVLRYISNEQKRFQIFVANRVQIIRDFSQPCQWNHIISELNPADEASRGLTVNELIDSAKWIKGPTFLTEDELSWPVSKSFTLDPYLGINNDTETVCATMLDDTNNTVTHLMCYFSDWYRLCRAVAVFLKLKQILLDRVRKRNTHYVERNDILVVQDIEKAELAVLQWLQEDVFPNDIKGLSPINSRISSQADKQRLESRVSKSSSLYKLAPYMENGLLRVGGRLSRASMPDYTKHPIILPRSHHVTTLIIRQVHENLGHAGRNHVLSELRNKYWILRGNSAVRYVLSKCVHCRRSTHPVQEQKMADLPACRTDNISPPFYNTGVDYFGSFIVKDGRKEIKRYGVLFTCLSSRAIHLEVAISLETDAFINVLRRFIARRGNVKSLWSDNGTNFIGAQKELRLALSEMNQEPIQSTLRREGIDWHFNPPTASHMGGVWERMIRSARKILTALLHEHGTRLDTDSFHTLLCEVEAIINSRPITNVSDDPDDLEPLTPNHILTGKSVVTIPPPGVFQREDVYMRRRWRRVQYLANLFWSRWRNEYLLLLQSRQKWNVRQRNMMKGDVVLVRDDTAPRSDWKLGLVEETENDQSGDVRAVTIKTHTTQLRRPINKLVLLVAADE